MGDERVTATSRAVRLSEIVRRILPLKYGQPTLVAVDGLTASGKTTLANELAAIIKVAGRPAIRAGIDDFHRLDELSRPVLVMVRAASPRARPLSPQASMSRAA